MLDVNCLFIGNKQNKSNNKHGKQWQTNSQFKQMETTGCIHL